MPYLYTHTHYESHQLKKTRNLCRLYRYIHIYTYIYRCTSITNTHNARTFEKDVWRAHEKERIVWSRSPLLLWHLQQSTVFLGFFVLLVSLSLSSLSNSEHACAEENVAPVAGRFIYKFHVKVAELDHPRQW